MVSRWWPGMLAEVALTGEALPVVPLRPGAAMPAWVGIALVLALLGALLAGLRWYQRRADPHPEWVRKLLHVGMGLVPLTFPWLFAEPWPVLLLAALAGAGLLTLRRVARLKEGLGHVVGDVARASWGELYFPLAVALVFLLSWRAEVSPGRRVLLYEVPMLVLTLADASAALVGIRYGRHRFRTPDGQKSAEGSVAFFLAACGCIHTPLLLCGDIGRAETLLIAVVLALLATMFEAVAWHGLDNLLLPLVVHEVLARYLGLPAAELAVRLAILGGLLAFVLAFRARTTLAGGGALAAALFGYVAWALGGWPWLLPPVVLFLTYASLIPAADRARWRVHNVDAVLSIAAAGLLWLFLARALGRPELVVPYTVSFAAQLALTGVARRKYQVPRPSAVGLVLASALEGGLAAFVPFLLLHRGMLYALECTAIATVAAAAAATAFYRTQPGETECPTDAPRWLRQAAHSALASTVGLVPCYLL